MDRAPNFISTFSFKLVSVLILIKIYLSVFPYKMQWEPLIFFISSSDLLHCRVGTNSQMIMALSRLSLPFSLLVLSLPVIASAGYDDSSKYGFDGIPADSPQANPIYGTKEDIYTPKPEEKVEEKEKPYYGTQKEEKENRLTIGVQGLVLCKSDSGYSPVQGASAKITCKAVDEDGEEKSVSISSEATDERGYFIAPLSNKLSGLEKLKVRECQAYLHSSPLKNCNVPTNVNRGIDGALLSAFRVLKEKKMKLYSVGPFFYTPQPQSTPTGY
ncbi:proline-rich protein 1 [Gossypium hirsutum]|uniref:Proline-rich protein 1 n=1 Tax=Gossypium hirsutum TaxID=3635 RepID=A0A1U8K0Z5_GOSHI|nr:proline-rich protein 1-like [Gossypium hirsutum]